MSNTICTITGNPQLVSENLKTAPLLALPKDIVRLLGFYIATDSLDHDAIENGLAWGQVSVVAYQTSRPSMDKIYIGADALRKIWNYLVVNRLVGSSCQCSSLKEIKAWFNDPKNAPKLSAIRELNFYNLEIGAIPPQIINFSGLRELSFERNQIRVIPSSIAQLPELEVLNLDDNQISEIPDSIVRCQKLSSLSLRGNPITQIPRSVTNCEHLEGRILLDNEMGQSNVKMDQGNDYMEESTFEPSSIPQWAQVQVEA
ncbi:MAG TPA: leucine-rich repeat domain-containing protein [Rhabdochlamydiaceae bacterium]